MISMTPPRLLKINKNKKDMDFSIRKGTKYISVFCQNLSYPLDLYCSNIKLVVEKEKTFELDFNSIFNDKQKTN